MLALVRNILLFSLVNGYDWPETLNHSQAGRLLIAWVADSAGLFEFPKCQRWKQARDTWGDVVAVEGRPLSEALRFPDGKIPGEEGTLYLRVCYGVIGPYRMYCHAQACRFGRVEAVQWMAMEAEMSRLYLIYDLLDDLGRDSVPLWKKRQKLAQLRDLLGVDAYERGAVPVVEW